MVSFCNLVIVLVLGNLLEEKLTGRKLPYRKSPYCNITRSTQFKQLKIHIIYLLTTNKGNYTININVIYFVSTFFTYLYITYYKLKLYKCIIYVLNITHNSPVLKIILPIFKKLFILFFKKSNQTKVYKSKKKYNLIPAPIGGELIICLNSIRYILYLSYYRYMCNSPLLGSKIIIIIIIIIIFQHGSAGKSKAL